MNKNLALGPIRRARIVALVATLTLWCTSALAGPVVVQQTNLVTSDPINYPAQLTDTGLTNAWGASYSPMSPFWVSANHSGLALLYGVDPSTNAVAKIMGLPQVTIPPPGSGRPTGQAFNTGAMGGSFNGDSFLFVSEDGTISGWRGSLGTTAEVLQVANPANVYKGTTLAATGGHDYLDSANFSNGTIDVLKGDNAAPDLLSKFTDPNLPSGYAPFNIQNLGGVVYVTYALQDATKTDDVPAVGNGFVDAFDLQGTFLARVASQGTLNSPWGLAFAPPSFGPIAGDLLVGNFGDGRINVFSLNADHTGNFLGQLDAAGGGPLEIEGLWALTIGNGGSGGTGGIAGNANEIYFTAGPDSETVGLLGVLQFAAAAPEPGTLALLAACLLAWAGPGRKLRRAGVNFD